MSSVLSSLLPKSRAKDLRSTSSGDDDKLRNNLWQTGCGKWALLDFDRDGSRFGLAGRVFSGERIRCGFARGHLNAAALRRPDGLGLRLELHRLRIGNAIAEFDGVAGMSALRIGVETKNVKSLAAHRVNNFLVLSEPLRRCFFFERPVLFPSRPERPAKINADHQKCCAGDKDISTKSFVTRLSVMTGLRSRFSKHGCLPWKPRVFAVYTALFWVCHLIIDGAALPTLRGLRRTGPLC